VSAEVFCSAAARAEGAPLAGTVSRAEIFLLVEHRGAWGARAVEENDLPAPAAAWLGAQLAALGEQGKTRALLIRRDDAASEELRCFLAVAREDRQELFSFAVGEPAELATLELAGGLAAGALAAHRSAQRLTLVCGNARRDRCCAREGRPVFAALARVAPPGSTWLSTHQGGHRHAAVGLWLPEGVAYGYLTPEDAPALLALRERAALHLPRFRGRCFHPSVVQAADSLLRSELAVDALDAWSLESVTESAVGWRVVLAGRAGRHEVTVARREEEALVSCTPLKRQRIERFDLVGWRTMQASGR
jgi:hypothetical protein